MEIKKEWYRNLHFTQYLIVIILVTGLVGFIISFVTNVVHINKLEEKVLNQKAYLDATDNLFMKLNDSTLVYQNKDFYSLQKDIISVQKINESLRNKIEDKHKDWVTYLASFWTITGLLLGMITVVFSFKSKVKFEVDKQVKIEVDKQFIEISNDIKKQVQKKVIEQVALANDISKEVVERVYITEQENSLLRNNAKVLLINEKGTAIDDWLNKVFNKGSELSKFNTTSLPFKDFKEVNDFKDYTLIVIDNTKLNRKNWKNFSGKEGNLTTIGEELLDLCDKALKQGIAILYFSEDVFFPSNAMKFNKLTNKGLLAYGNAHSKIYPNAMDVLKNQKLFK